MVAISDYEHLFYRHPDVVRSKQEAIRVLTEIAKRHRDQGDFVSTEHHFSSLSVHAIIPGDFKLTYKYSESARKRKDGGFNWRMDIDFLPLQGRCPSQRMCHNCVEHYGYSTGDESRWTCRAGRLNGPMMGHGRLAGCSHHRFPDEVRR